LHEKNDTWGHGTESKTPPTKVDENGVQTVKIKFGAAVVSQLLKEKCEEVERALYQVIYPDHHLASGEYKIIDVSDFQDKSRFFIHYEIEAKETSEFICECKSLDLAKDIVAALSSYRNNRG
jgi:hypothetical protein